MEACRELDAGALRQLNGCGACRMAAQLQPLFHSSWRPLLHVIPLQSLSAISSPLKKTTISNPGSNPAVLGSWE